MDKKYFLKKEIKSLPELEEKILQFWKANRIFEKSLEKTKKGRPYTFYDGPPFATGLPHYGHILASTIKDVIPRYQTMKGRFVRRRWGWDCHGLPVEEIVERQLGISGKKQIEKIGIAKFNETCRSIVLTYAKEWGRMIERISRWVEFEDSYKTMDSDYMESVWWAFKKVYDKGLAYEGRKVLLYCPRCETPVSNFEVAMDHSYRTVTEDSATVKFAIKTGQKIGNWNVSKSTYLLAWTTTPWTLPGNVAIAAGKNIEYLAVSAVDGIYILAEKLVGNVFPDKNFKIVKKFKGKDLSGLSYESLFNVPALKSAKTFKIYLADFVSLEEGTGLVHTAVVYGEEDYELGQKFGLPVVPLFDEKGRFNNKAPSFLRGEYFKDADRLIIADLEKRGFLLRKDKHTHSYPYCWRCGNVLFYNAIPAWFVNIRKIKKELLRSNDKEINWFPGHLKHGRYEKSIEQAPDWNISRNRYWGNPIPVWKCRKCQHFEAFGSLDQLAKKNTSRNRYWVMRHGESEIQIEKILDYGQKKYHLTVIGRDQVRQSAEKLKKELGRRNRKIDLIISSPILRCRESAIISAKVLGLPELKFAKNLEEIRFGPELIGSPEKKYHQLYPTYKSKFEIRPPEGESLRDLRKRISEFIETLEKKYRNKSILLVSHEYPLWMLFQSAEGWSEKLAILEKEKQGDDFINVGEIRKLDFKVLPRNISGEVDLHRPYIDEISFSCPKCGGRCQRISEIFDSWIEAGSMPFAEYHYPFENKKTFKSRFPAQFVAEYIAQTRAWFYLMHVISLILFGRAPFENVVTTGTILAEDGSKMSKSKGNFPDPWLVINKYGADSLRFYLMNSTVMQADNLNFSVRDLENIYRKTMLLLWNVYKYFAAYIEGEKWNERPAKNQKMAVLDRWITGRTQKLIVEVTSNLDLYNTVRATRSIQEYVDDLSTWYLRRSRGRKDKAFFKTFHDCLMAVAKVTAPFTPYLSEFIYSGLKEYSLGEEKAESVHLASWPKADRKIIDKKLFKDMLEIRRLASLALAKRAEDSIKVRQPLAELKLKNYGLNRRKELLEILKDEVNVKKIVLDQNITEEILLDTRVTPRLREEGFIRELRRTIQNLRQGAGLKPQDRIGLFLELPEEFRLVVSKNERNLKNNVNAKRISYKKSAKFDIEIETKINEQKIWVGLKKLNRL